MTYICIQLECQDSYQKKLSLENCDLGQKIYVSSASSCWKTDEAICQKKIKPRKKQKYFRWRKKIVNKGVKFLCLIEQCDEYCIQIKNWRAEQNLLLFNFIEKNCWWYRCKKKSIVWVLKWGKNFKDKKQSRNRFRVCKNKKGSWLPYCCCCWERR